MTSAGREPGAAEGVEIAEALLAAVEEAFVVAVVAEELPVAGLAFVPALVVAASANSMMGKFRNE